MEFLIWLLILTALCVFAPSWGIWGFIITGLILGHDTDTSSSSSGSFSGGFSSGDYNSSGSNSTSGYRGTGYDPGGGGVKYYPNGNTSYDYGGGPVTYYSNGIRSTQSGNVTYYNDDTTGNPIGYSVNLGNGVCNYHANDGHEIGSSYTNGNYTTYTGDCFECR